MPDPSPATGSSPEYRAVQERLARGWNTWDTRSVLSHVRLPDGVLVALGVKEYYRGTTLRHVQIGRQGDDVERVVLGPHAVDGRATEVVVDWRGVELRVRSAHDGDDLVLLVEPLRNQARPAALTVAVDLAWGMPGIAREIDGTITAETPHGVTTVHASAPRVADPYVDVDGPHLVVELAGAVAISTGRPRTVAEAEQLVSRAQQRLTAEAADEHAEIIRDAIAWNTIYEPAGRRVITTVSRLWNVGKRGGYAMFCWDAFFGALLAGRVSPDLSAANVLEMLAELTPEGFVPNVAQGTGRRTYDGSQPPFAALIAWELARVLDLPWLLRDAYPALLSWNRWWWRVRRDGDLLCLGSTFFEPESPSPQDIPRIHQHFGATCESGADDHPVFSDVPFDPESSLLRAHDIGLNSEYVLDCEYLARIADALGEHEDAAELRERGDGVATAVRERLWDPDARIYRSHFSDTGLPTAFLSPMSFFPMFAGLADEGRARDLAAHLRDEGEFGGEWVIPVSPRDDDRTAKQSYWSGRAWPPINFLVYLGLLRAGRDDDRAWLAERSAALVLTEWREHRHVHENYSSETGAGCDVPNSEPFLTWGALLSLIQQIETGQTDYFADWRDPAPGSPHPETPSPAKAREGHEEGAQQ